MRPSVGAEVNALDAPIVERRTTNDERRTTNDERREPNDERSLRTKSEEAERHVL
jgi:hypothetical protein